MTATLELPLTVVQTKSGNLCWRCWHLGFCTNACVKNVSRIPIRMFACGSWCGETACWVSGCQNPNRNG